MRLQREDTIPSVVYHASCATDGTPRARARKVLVDAIFRYVLRGQVGHVQRARILDQVRAQRPGGQTMGRIRGQQRRRGESAHLQT